MTAPYAGHASDEYRPVCVYAEAPGEPGCNKLATWHIAVADAHYGQIAFSACNAHAPIARSIGRFIREHPFGGFCGMPGTLWHAERNECILDDSGIETVYGAHEVEQASP